MSWVWSYLLSAIGLFGMWVSGTRAWGWLIGVLVQPLWVSYALVTHQYGFIISSVAYGTVQYRNWRKVRVRRADV